METVALTIGGPSSWVTRPERTASWARPGTARSAARTRKERVTRRVFIPHLQQKRKRKIEHYADFSGFLSAPSRAPRPPIRPRPDHHARPRSGPQDAILRPP